MQAEFTRRGGGSPLDWGMCAASCTLPHVGIGCRTGSVPPRPESPCRDEGSCACVEQGQSVKDVLEDRTASRPATYFARLRASLAAGSSMSSVGPPGVSDSSG